jgi:hypothetical protein
MEREPKMIFNQFNLYALKVLYSLLISSQTQLKPFYINISALIKNIQLEILVTKILFFQICWFYLKIQKYCCYFIIYFQKV